MKKKSISKLFLTFVCLPLLLSACNNNSNTKNYSNDQRFKIYQLALADGYSGTYEEWLASIKGTDGKDGHSPVITIGENGNWFIDGVDTGVKAQGENGKDGDSPYIGANGNWWVGETDTGVKATGDQGNDGKSAYDLYCEAHPEYTGTEEEWLDDLVNGRLGNKEKHTIKFYINQTLYQTQEVEHGHLLNRLDEDPLELGKVFDGWYSSDNEKWLFDRYPVYGDFNLFAQYTNEHFTYELINDKAFITSYDGLEENVFIPLSSGGYDVVGIGERAFKDCTATSITLTSNIQSIGFCAFENCINITEIEIPSSVVSMGNTAFIGCSSLEKVIYNTSAFPSNGSLFMGSSIKTVVFGGNSVPEKACYGCTNITKVLFGENTISIGNYAFYGCTRLTSVSLPKSMTYPGFYSFHSSGLKFIHLHEGINNVNDSFRECPFEYIVLPVSLTSITSQAFLGCPDSMITYYKGTQTQWEQVSISSDSSVIKNHVYYYSVNEPASPGNYWHYISGVPTVW